jgi:uncharacterized protein
VPELDKLDLKNPNKLDLIIDYRRFLVSGIAVITLFLVFLIPQLGTDPSLKSGVDTSSESYQEYRKFIKVFGDEEFLLVAIKNEAGINNPETLSALDSISKHIRENPTVAEVVSLSTLKVFQYKDGLYGTYPFLEKNKGGMALPDRTQLDAILKALPVTDYLISPDHKTAGILIRIKEQFKYDPEAIKPLLSDLDNVIKRTITPGSQYRIVGAPIIRKAIVKYSVDTGIFFGIICLAIGTVVSAYIFRNILLTAVTNIILIVCVIWILGLMALLGIPLNSTTALSFGFIPITTLELVIHMAVRYHQFHRNTKDKLGALKQSVRWLARPCLICSGTTAVGFGTLMIGSIPMVRQLGFIMSVGMMISYFLAFVLTPGFFSSMKSLDAVEPSTEPAAWLDKILRRVENLFLHHSRPIIAVGIVLTVILFAGTPFIKSDIQVSRMLSENTKEIKDIKYVETNLANVNSVELMIEGKEDAFRNPEVWKKVAQLEHRLLDDPEVVSIDSLLPLLDYLNGLFSVDKKKSDDFFSNPSALPQILSTINLTEDGRRIAGRFMDPQYKTLRMSIRIKNSPSIPISETIEKIRHLAASEMSGIAEVSVTGDLAVFSGQTSELISDQIESMVIAVVLITILMMIQMNSITLGLICLIPNIPPVAAVFGIMGWFGVSLDGVTVFAATVAIGLAVDNTLHFLTQLKRDIVFCPNETVDQLVVNSFRLTSRQIASWTSVTLLGFLALAVSPFKPVVLFGLLGCSALVLGMFGDLLFVQSLVIGSKSIRNAIVRLSKATS